MKVKMIEYKITIREFPDKKPSERYSFTIGTSTRGWYSLRKVIEMIKKEIERK